MRRIRPVLATLLLAALARPSLAAWPNQPHLNVMLSNAASDQVVPQLVSDGEGGAIVTWYDYRSGSSDIYAQHVLASGAVDPAWPVNGRALCTATGNQVFPTIASDGAGGAIVTWADYRNDGDIYAQHVLASGAVDPSWPVNGRALCTAANEQTSARIVTDGAGGAIVTWSDQRSGSEIDIYAQRVLASGAVDPGWLANGRALCTAAGVQLSPRITTDGAGGAIVTWEDNRPGLFRDIYAQRILSSGALGAGFPADGVALCSATNDQFGASIVSDDAGGAIVTWTDFRSGSAYDVFAQRVLGSGTVDPAWPVNGRSICSEASFQLDPAIAADGAGGAIVSWIDYRSGPSDIYAQRVLISGAVDPSWPVDGRALCTAAGDQFIPEIVSDGAGGGFVIWEDLRSGADDVYAQRVLASGIVDPAWPVNGRHMSNAAGSQGDPVIVADDAGGAIVTWHDYRSANNDIYAQRVGRYGYLGTPEAEIASVEDVPNDQGGRVKVSWLRSYVEDDPTTPVTYYRLFRSVPPNLAQSLVAGGERVIRSLDDSGSPEPGDLLAATSDGLNTYFWEFVAQIDADFLPGHSYLAPTAQDSTGDGAPLTAFMVQARAAGNRHWESLPATGYSVDDLAPAAPAPFTGTYDSGTSYLHWGRNLEADLAGYRLYRGTTAGFVPSPSNLIAAPPDTGHVDAAGAPYVYKLTAIDIHGNESLVATLIPNGALDVAGGRESGTFLALAGANPSHRAATLRFGLARAGHATLSLYDAGGRRLRTLVSGTPEAGEHSASWDGRDEAGNRVAAGLYFAKLEVDGVTRVKRLAMLK